MKWDGWVEVESMEWEPANDKASQVSERGLNIPGRQSARVAA